MFDPNTFNEQVMLLKSWVRHQLDEQQFHDWI